MSTDPGDLSAVIAELVAEMKGHNTPSGAPDMMGLKIQLAELCNDLKHIAHDVKGLTTKLDAQQILFVPRKEIENTNGAFDARLKKIEDNINKAAWAIIGAWLAGLVTVATLAKKLFL